MTTRITTNIIIVNVIMGLLLYLSSQAMLLHLTATHPYLTVTGVNIDKIYVGAVQPSSSPTPLVIGAFPNLPFYILLLPLIINAYLIIKVTRSVGIAKRFPATITLANIITGFVMFLSSQTMLSQLGGTMNNYVRVSGVNFLSFYVGAVQVGSSPIPLVVWSESNLPSYVFLFSLIVNACFIIKLLSEKSKQTPS